MYKVATLMANVPPLFVSVSLDTPAISAPNLDKIELKLGRAQKAPLGDLYLGPWAFVREDMPKLLAAAQRQSATSGVAAIHIMSAIGDLEEPVTPLKLAEARESLQLALAALKGETP